MLFFSYSSQYLQLLKKKVNKTIAKENIRSSAIKFDLFIILLIGIILTATAFYVFVGIYASITSK